LQGQYFTHLFCEFSQSDGGVIVDGESQIIGVVDGEQSFIILSVLFLLELFGKIVNTHVLGDFLEEYFEEHSCCGCCRIWSETDGLEHLPINSLTAEQVAEQPGEISNFVGFLLEDIVVVVEESLKE
jgi:hypothetical protein